MTETSPYRDRLGLGSNDSDRPSPDRRSYRSRRYTVGISPSDIEKSDSPEPTKEYTPILMANSAGKLAQEINEEFLTCKICLETYKEPKSLNCLHTFCESCIENHAMSESSYKKYSEYRDFTCPLCRKRTHLPTGGVKALPDNFLVASLTEVITRQKPTKFPFCDICKLVAKKHREASSKCLDCAKLLCKQCVEVHRETKVTKNHSIFDVEIEKDVECKDHPEEVVRFYCEPCETCVCVLCTFNEHKDHDISNFSDAVMTYKDSIQKLLNGCKDKLDKHEQQLDTLAKADKSLKQAEQKIRDVSIQFISEIRTREKQLIEELHNLYGPALMEFIHRKADMQITLEGLKSTCNLTELILKGKDIELLLLKNQVQEKLRNLSDLDLKPLPPTVGKQVQFVPGALDMGYIQDMDRPLSMSKIRARRAFSSSSSTEYRDMQEQPEVRTTDTQTDSSITSASNCEKTTMTDKPNTNDKNCATVPPTVITVGLQTDVPSPENTSANVVDVTVNLIPDTEESSLVQESREERERRRRQARRMREENGEQEDEEDSRVTRRQRRRRMNRASNEGDSFESNRKSREFTSPPPPFRRVERQSQVYHGDSLEDNSSP